MIVPDTATLIERLREAAGDGSWLSHPCLLREAADALAELVERGQNLVDALGMEREMRTDAEAALARAREALAAYESKLRLVVSMAEHGVAADTTPEQCLATIAHFARAALDAADEGGVHGSGGTGE